MSATRTQGLRENLGQFSVLVLVNAFVGAMIGLERSIFPQYAQEFFGISSASAILAFITAFGVTKAAANYFAGRWANRYGRRRILLLGWIFALPVPLLLLYAPSWSWVIIANVLLGINQGLAWSSTVIMKIDLVGERNRGLAMGINEFAGYLAVGLAAFGTGWLAEHFGLRPYPFYLGMVISWVGLLLSFFAVRETRDLVQLEHSEHDQAENVFWNTTLKNPSLSSITQAGLVNNLNDGMIWGLLPMLLLSLHFDNAQIGVLVALYPAVWGMGQLFTGRLADRYPIKPILFIGMILQGLVIIGLTRVGGFYVIAALSICLGLGTALVYPTFLTGIAQFAHPEQRAESIGAFRLWRDLGYAIGAVISGIIADQFGIPMAIMAIGALTLLSAVMIQLRMPRST